MSGYEIRCNVSSEEEMAAAVRAVIALVPNATTGKALAGEPSGVWYCRTHRGLEHEDDITADLHGHECDEAEHTPSCWSDGCTGECSPCDFVELLIPGGES